MIAENLARKQGEKRLSKHAMALFRMGQQNGVYTLSRNLWRLWYIREVFFLRFDTLFWAKSKRVCCMTALYHNLLDEWFPVYLVNSDMF